MSKFDEEKFGVDAAWLKSILVDFDPELDGKKMIKFVDELDGEDERHDMILNLLQLTAWCACQRMLRHDGDAYDLRKQRRQSEATYDEICNFRLRDLVLTLRRLAEEFPCIKSEAEHFADRIEDVDGDDKSI